MKKLSITKKRPRSKTQSIDIVRPKDILVVELMEHGQIIKGSKLFCGHCGNPVGVFNKGVRFPFTATMLGGFLKEKMYSQDLFGFVCKHCNNSMFGFDPRTGGEKTYDFVPMINFISGIY